jgi:hypothetical protein
MSAGVRDSVDADSSIRTLVTRLSRTSRSGEAVIEHAAIIAEGADSRAIIRWILAHGGEPEAKAPQAPSRGLHGGRSSAALGAASGTPRRYVLPAGTLG